MDIDFGITEVDIYRTHKPELFALAQKYKIRLPAHPSLITVPILRQALALTQGIFKRAQVDEKFLEALGELFFNCELSRVNEQKYPQLLEYKELLDHIYDNPEEISFIGTEEDPDLTLEDDKEDTVGTYQNVNLETARKLSLSIKEARKNIETLKEQLKTESNLTPQGASSLELAGSSYDNNLIIEHEKLLIDRKTYNIGDSHNQLSSLESELDHYEKLIPKNLNRPLPNVPNKDTDSIEVPKAPEHPQQSIPNHIMAEQENKILIKPIVYSGDQYENVNEFLYRFNIAAEANFWSNETKKRLFPCYLQSYAHKWYTNFVAHSPNADYETLKLELKNAFSSDNYVEELKYKLENRVQGSEESPNQYLYIIQDLCRKINPNVTDNEIISHVTKGLKPIYFNALMYLESNNIAQFQSNLKKLETKFLLQKVNAKKHSLELESTENLNLIQDKYNPQTASIKQVKFSEQSLDTNTQFVNILTDISQTLTDLKIQNRPVERATSTGHRDSTDDRGNSHYNSSPTVRSNTPTQEHNSRRDSFDRRRVRNDSPSPYRAKHKSQERYDSTVH